jgi:hypothetical protein
VRGGFGWRYVLFALVSLSLFAAAFALGSDSGPSQSDVGSASIDASAQSAVPAVALKAVGNARRSMSDLQSSADRFLNAYFRYEVGEAGGGVAARFGSTTTPGFGWWLVGRLSPPTPPPAFGRSLLAAPPRPSAAGLFPSTARLGKLETFFVSAAADRAVVNGEAKRGPAGERFSFVFVLTPAGVWLASGVGE